MRNSKAKVIRKSISLTYKQMRDALGFVDTHRDRDLILEEAPIFALNIMRGSASYVVTRSCRQQSRSLSRSSNDYTGVRLVKLVKGSR